MHWYDVLSIWAWLVGGLGLVGALALIAVTVMGAPWLAAVVGERVAKLIGELLNTTIGLVLVVGACAWFGSYLVTAHQAKAECRDVVAKMKQHAEELRKQRDDEIAAQVKQQYEPEIAKLKEREAARNKEASNGQGNGCRLGANALRLRKSAQGAPAKRGR